MVDHLADRTELTVLHAQRRLLGVERNPCCQHLSTRHSGHGRSFGVGLAAHRRAGVGGDGKLRKQDGHRQQADQANSEALAREHTADDSRSDSNALGPIRSWSQVMEDGLDPPSKHRSPPPARTPGT